jgi:hypothetical protein
MSDESKEMEKQLGLYADTITVVATAQLLAFIYQMAQGGCFTRNVLSHIWLPIGIGSAVNLTYLGLVSWCHRALGRISGATGTGKEPAKDIEVQGIARNIQAARCWIIIADLVMTLGVLGLIYLGVHLGQFCFDCKK